MVNDQIRNAGDCREIAHKCIGIDEVEINLGSGTQRGSMPRAICRLITTTDISPAARTARRKFIFDQPKQLFIEEPCDADVREWLMTVEKLSLPRDKVR